MAVADFNNASVGQEVLHPDGDRNAIGLPRDSVNTMDRIAIGVQWSTAEITGLVAFDRNDIAGAGTAMAQGVEGGDARAHQWSGFLGRKIGRNARQRFHRDAHELRVAAVVADAGNLELDAGDKVAAPARFAARAVSAVPSNADAIADLPRVGVLPDRIDHPGDFVTG